MSISKNLSRQLRLNREESLALAFLADEMFDAGAGLRDQNVEGGSVCHQRLCRANPWRSGDYRAARGKILSRSTFFSALTERGVGAAAGL
jgi:hypothetical protein